MDTEQRTAERKARAGDWLAGAGGFLVGVLAGTLGNVLGEVVKRALGW